jgi:DNA-directed RNA polymerase specialized sigma24 family protein
MTEQKWTVEKVKYWLGIAALVDRALPPVMPPKVSGQKWDIIREWYELLWDQDTEDLKPRIQPTNEQISMWEEVVLRWFRMIDSDKDKKIIWLRSCGLSYPRISKKLGISRQTIIARYQTALERLVQNLNKL